jgi:hypothetical protein
LLPPSENKTHPQILAQRPGLQQFSLVHSNGRGKRAEDVRARQKDFMLRFFFHRDSKMVLIMEIFGLGGVLCIGIQLFSGQVPLVSSIFFIVVFTEYTFIRFCALKRWYAHQDRSAGIGLHFKKAMVPTSYILACNTWLFVLTHQGVFLAAAFALFMIIIHVHIILLVLHRKDHNENDINVFSTIG